MKLSYYEWGWLERTSFLGVLFLVSFPSTFIYYSAPFAALGLIRREGALAYTVRFGCMVAIWVGTALLFQLLRGRDVSLPAVFFSIITYAPLWLTVLLAHGMRAPDESTWNWLLSVLTWWLLIQAALGSFAFAVSGNPDMVSGTFGFLKFLRGQVTISQVMFTATVFPVAMILLTAHRRPLHLVAGIAGFGVAILAQSGHQTLFLLAAGAVTIPIASGQAKTLVAAMVLGGLIVAGVLIAYPSTQRNAVMWYEKTVLNEESPKRMTFDAMVNYLKDPETFFFGRGPGQFCSRAGLIASGQYLTVSLPSALIDPSPAFSESIRPGLDRFKRVGEGSAIAQPFSSAMAVPVELGIPAAFGLFGGLLLIYARLLRKAINLSGRPRNLAMGTAILIIAFLLCCLVENYIEFVQGVTIPIILLVICLKSTLGSNHYE